MKKLTIYHTAYAMLFLFLTTLSSCTVVKDIFKAGMWFGIIGVVALVMLLFWVIRRLGK